MISLLLLTIGLYRSHREEISSEEQGGVVVQ
jgi:hypothetical protein